MQPLKRKARRPHSRGFTLVITLILMILLTVIAVGLLSLSTVTLRTTAQGQAMASARANARMALMLAIGQLQKAAGADTRVTARADILDEKNPLVLGAWKSWEGSDHEVSGTFAGRPVSPGNYRGAKESRFISWLASAGMVDATTVPDTLAGTGKVTLVGTGSLGTEPDRVKNQIHLTALPVGGSGRQQGGVAWWIGGENQKVRLPKPVLMEGSATEGRWAARAKSHSTADPEPFRMDSVLTDPEPAEKVISLRGADLLADPGDERVSEKFFHDLSAVSVGLLTNTATGGWRKDLSLLTENWSAQPASDLPFFRTTPANNLLTKRATTGSPVAPGSMLYPWAAYRSGTAPIYRLGAVCSWENLVDYATFYKRVSASSSGRFTTSAVSGAIDGDAYAFIHKVRILPVIARIQWVFSHWADKPAGAAADSTLLEPRLLMTPVITLWNPYNVEISAMTGLSFKLLQPMPTALKYHINGSANSNYNAVMGGSVTNKPGMGASILSYSIGSIAALKPGETRVFSPAATARVVSGENLVLTPGYRNGGGNYFPVLNDQGQRIAAAAGTTIKADAKFDTVHVQEAELPKNGVGISFDMMVNNSATAHLAYRSVRTPALAGDLYAPMADLASTSLEQCRTNPQPFLSTMFGARMASRTHIAAKGLLQSSPLVNYTAMGKDEVEWGLRRDYGGNDNPVNSPFDYSFVAHTTGDSLLPTSDATNFRGRIVTGFTSMNGLSRCTLVELPTRPLTSLGELTHWDLRYDNPIPPFALNLIGNSDATPLLPAGAVYNSADAGVAANLQYDDSYCANHLLFDDWFLSSIAPDPTSFGSTGRNQRTVFTDLVSGANPLPNQAYQAMPADIAVGRGGTSAALKLFTDHVSRSDSWKTIASRLEVEGMFNVNSTSVAAWRALLGHARGQKVAHYSETGATWSAKLSSTKDHAVSRFSVAADSEAGETSTAGSFADASEFGGYRTLDDAFLDELAEKVVDQVRLRGPFLSLSEFVNRQLSSGELALAGTLQAALNKVTESSSTNILQKIQAASTVSTANPMHAAEAGYKFPEAAVGYSSYGLPGWTRQVDILRPIAPILSARDDTFTIRAYGDSRDAAGKILASSVCEAVVRRTRDFIDPKDAANILTEPVSETNKVFGRRLQVISFRWLAAGEI